MASEPPPIDLEEFRAAMRAAGIEEIVDPMLDLFKTETAKGMMGISTAWGEGDLEAVGRAAHSLKSSAGNVRAKTLADALQQLEHAAARGDRAATETWLETVRGASAAALAYLAEIDPGA